MEEKVLVFTANFCLTPLSTAVTIFNSALFNLFLPVAFSGNRGLLVLFGVFYLSGFARFNVCMGAAYTTAVVLPASVLALSADLPMWSGLSGVTYYFLASLLVWKRGMRYECEKITPREYLSFCYFAPLMLFIRALTRCGYNKALRDKIEINTTLVGRERVYSDPNFRDLYVIIE